MKRAISKPERVLLTIAVAQKYAGSNDKEPTARQLRKAFADTEVAMYKRGVGIKGGPVARAKVGRFVDRCCEALSGITGMGGDDVGSFWSKVKDLVTTAATKAQPFTPFLSPSASVLMPVVKSALAARQQKQLAPVQEQREDGVQEVSGESIANAYSLAERDLMRGNESGYGSSELGSMRRFVSGNAPAIPHNLYRLGIITRARKLAGGSTPSTRHLAAAQTSVDKDLRASGIRLAIPGARPGRVTR